MTKSRTCMHGSTRVSVLQGCTLMSYALPGLVLLARPPAFAPVRLTRHVSRMGLLHRSVPLSRPKRNIARDFSDGKSTPPARSKPVPPDVRVFSVTLPRANEYSSQGRAAAHWRMNGALAHSRRCVQAC